MSTVQRQIGTTAFRTSESPYALPGLSAARSGLGSERAEASPHRVPPQPSVMSRPNTQAGWLALWLIVAFTMMAAGMLYLSGYASLTQQGYRRAHLLGALRRERDFSQQWRHQQAVVNTPAYIEHGARALGMVRADDAQTVYVPER